jgi:hypothetical protein
MLNKEETGRRESKCDKKKQVEQIKTREAERKEKHENEKKIQ